MIQYHVIFVGCSLNQVLHLGITCLVADQVRKYVVNPKVVFKIYIFLNKKYTVDLGQVREC
jgi:hypothetical protein